MEKTNREVTIIELSSGGFLFKLPELCRALKRSPKFLHDQVAAGCPVVDRGGHGKAAVLNLADFFTWWTERTRSTKHGGQNKIKEENDPRNREKAARADISELNLAKMRGELCYVSDVKSLIEDNSVAVRQSLLEFFREEFDGTQASGEAIITRVLNRYAEQCRKDAAELKPAS